jgi:hypothetical protein
MKCYRDDAGVSFVIRDGLRVDLIDLKDYERVTAQRKEIVRKLAATPRWKPAKKEV